VAYHVFDGYVVVEKGSDLFYVDFGEEDGDSGDEAVERLTGIVL
jgi:hypothetical protein